MKSNFLSSENINNFVYIFISNYSIDPLVKFLKIPEGGDPSRFTQLFSGLNINLLCCRYWWLKNWESQNMSFPYWRIYWNKNPGGVISFAEKTIQMTPDQIILIPPNTAFSSRIKGNPLPRSGYNLEGARMESSIVEEERVNAGAVLHLFIHFNLGMPYDFIAPELFCFELDMELQNDLQELSGSLKENPEQLSVSSSLLIYKIIILSVSRIQREYWNLSSKDHRMLNVLRMIEGHIQDELLNKNLARAANMAVNSFARSFRSEFGMTPQQFVRERRVQKASIMLHHTTNSIDEIAGSSGFCDRFHLARVFKDLTGYSPAQYRKKFNPKN